MIKIGFTGTRHGVNEIQKEEFLKLISHKDFNEFHHGICVGSDEETDNIVNNYREKNKKEIKIVGHPPKYKKFMSSNCNCDVLMKPYDYLERNHNIVDACEILVATPDTKEKLRSGTWSTIRYARKKGKRIYIIYPSGRVEIE